MLRLIKLKLSGPWLDHEKSLQYILLGVLTVFYLPKFEKGFICQAIQLSVQL